MKLIDADALEKLFREVIGGIAKEPELTGSLEHMVRASSMVIQMIQDAPMIDIALLKDLQPFRPVKKHGTYWCAKCDKHLKTIGLNIRDNYCSHCGTKVLWNGDENE